MKAAAAMISVGPMIERLLRQIARAIAPRLISLVAEAGAPSY